MPGRPPRPDPVDSNPKGDFVGPAELPDELTKVLDERFKDSWPPDDAVVNAMTQEDQIVVAVESQPVANYPQIRQELLSAKVLSVEFFLDPQTT